MAQFHSLRLAVRAFSILRQPKKTFQYLEQENTISLEKRIEVSDKANMHT
jgi:hypothetical protein